MKKLIAMTIGLGLVLGTVSFAKPLRAVQDPLDHTQDDKKTEKKKGKKKTSTDDKKM